MEELIGKFVELRESSGYGVEGKLVGNTGGLIPKWKLVEARQINWVNEEAANHAGLESWDLPGTVYVAEHCVSIMHESHLKDRRARRS